jgi:ferredoxin-NADP reductase/nitrite reductase/ring-hydroxylating ferredoxin subunit
VDDLLADVASNWFPVAAAEDLPRRHVYAGQLAGHELAIWRADDGNINVWEDRCVHRGVRLSIGKNDGAELMCQYHGWRYANRTGGCTYIPAHPADAPAQTICVRSFPVCERYGLVWSTIDADADADADAPTIDALNGCDVVALRGLPFDATPQHVLERLAGHTFAPSGAISAAESLMSAHSLYGLGVVLTATAGTYSSTAVFFVEPLDSDRAFVRPVLVVPRAEAAGMDVLVHHAHALDDLRTAIELEARSLQRPAKLSPPFEPIDEPTNARSDPRRAPLRVRVAAKRSTAAGIVAFDLEPLSATLPTFQAGSHIDVHLGNGLVRQYSLTNGPDETGLYRIGVKLSEPSNGGSAWLHDHVREGDVLAISEPHNNFTLRRDALQTILIAGGIGVTPLLAMAKTIARTGLDWALHYFAQGAEHVAFRTDLERFGDSVVLHLGLDPTATTAELERILATPAEFAHVYICGPAPMLDAARQVAAEQGWQDVGVHFEYFENATEVSDSSEFEISLARSALTLPVRAGETILEVLRANGVPMSSSCEQGACGTCLVRVIDGEPDHQDVYMSDAEHAAGDRIATCISRARSKRLILDI